jgi:IS1 family transposase/transposase-like protein
MLCQIIIYQCRTCGSTDIVKNGTNKCGNQQYHCKNCGAYRVLEAKRGYTQVFKECVLKAYRERMSLRGIERVFGICRQTTLNWLEEHVATLPPLVATLLAAEADDVLELDEVWSFVASKDHKRWVWTVMCRRTRQIIAFAIGDRSEKTCRELWQAIPTAYRRCHSFSDFWKAYANVFPADTHHSVGKESGQTAHIERWYNTLRQWLARYTRKTLAFSKSDYYHALVTRWFIVEHNLRMCPSLTT